MNHDNFDGAEDREESNEDDDISGLLRDLAAGLDDKGDFDDSSSELEPCAELLALEKLVAENSKELCMKQSDFIRSFLIPGKYGPGSDMDVYYQPLVADLLDMFEKGVRTYDASKREYFQL
jgi:hypothetical protein